MNVFEQWQAGDISPYQALYALTSDLAEVESELEPLQQQREELRNAISHIVGTIGDKAEISGFGRLEITAATKSVSYDRKAVQAVINDLLALGETEIAQRLVLCQRETSRAGSLRITRVKERAS
jgi:hypothetical protein